MLENILMGTMIKCFRFVDDYLIIVRSLTSSKNINNIFAAFDKAGMGLGFTHELPANNEIQFLDLLLRFIAQHICGQYIPRTSKPILNYAWAHSKL